MKILLVFVVFATLFSTGCVSTYMVDRTRDLADIVTVCGGIGAGAKARGGPIQIGVLANADVVGLRGGDGFFQRLNFDSSEYPCVFEASCYGVDIYDGADTWDILKVSDLAGARDKNFSASGRWGYNTAISDYYYWQVEVLLGLGPSVRVGFNFAEAVDFLTGIVAVDLLADDIGNEPEPIASDGSPDGTLNLDISR